MQVKTPWKSEAWDVRLQSCSSCCHCWKSFCKGAFGASHKRPLCRIGKKVLSNTRRRVSRRNTCCKTCREVLSYNRRQPAAAKMSIPDSAFTQVIMLHERDQPEHPQVLSTHVCISRCCEEIELQCLLLDSAMYLLQQSM